MSDDLVDLQTHLAFQEHTLSELNLVVTSQQEQIDRLRLELRILQQKLGELEESVEVVHSGNEKPPHY